MTLTSYLKLVEIQTKVASVFPFLLGTVYTLYRFKTFNPANFIIMFISLISIDMATTAINNYFDYKKAKKKHGFNYESHNAIVKYGLKEYTVLAVIGVLLTTATVFGIMLYTKTNIMVLILGAISFVAGVMYSFGPVSISHTPLGELFSGIFMGFIIVFISIYIHIFNENILTLTYINGLLNIRIDIKEILYIALVSIPAILTISNIMLANNICDIKDDIENKRYTLPIYIGKSNALKLFKILYRIVYIDIVILIILRIEPIVSVVVLSTLIPVSKNITQFFKKQTKKDTFVLAVKNFLLINGTHVLALGIGVVIKLIKAL